jgi:hypothetical protein
MKHTIEHTHIYQPMEGLKIEIEPNGTWFIYHQEDLVEPQDFSWNKPEDRAVLVAIAEVIQYHNAHVINPKINPITTTEE